MPLPSGRVALVAAAVNGSCIVIRVMMPDGVPDSVAESIVKLVSSYLMGLDLVQLGLNQGETDL